MADWIKRGASKHPGRFSEKAARAGKTTKEFAAEKSSAPGKLGQEARFAENAMGAARKSRLPYKNRKG